MTSSCCPPTHMEDSTFNISPLLSGTANATPEIPGTTPSAPPVGGLIGPEAMEVFRLVNFVSLYGLVSFFGTVTNVINIAVLVKLGFKDTVNLGLFGLALSDLGCLLTLFWMAICFNPAFAFSPAVPFAPYEVQYLTGGWPHVCFVRTSSWITAFVTFERCLCVTLPFKVKSLVTPKRVVIVLSTIFFLTVASVTPVYYTSRMRWLFYPAYNRTLIGLTFTDNREEVEAVTLILNNFVSPITSFVLVSICTLILVLQLKRKTEWRSKSVAASAKSNDVTSARDKKVVRMVVTMSTVFIITFAPGTLTFLCMALIPEYSIVGRYSNLFNVSFSFVFILESINSSVNLFVFYKMSSRYREVFNAMFLKKSQPKNK
ncbi:tachykinin-like peptides receptor 86C [Aplysia californica]|uniref:Tachykinin-like peptides receptor 86C n=1 Tax=Aplysia californica TaxID=6500 RepID=A0ABM0K778_APLCA|nr:tachykinin-like peptides receptor 86C [Aplysia californica]